MTAEISKELQSVSNQYGEIVLEHTCCPLQMLSRHTMFMCIEKHHYFDDNGGVVHAIICNVKCVPKSGKICDHVRENQAFGQKIFCPVFALYI